MATRQNKRRAGYSVQDRAVQKEPFDWKAWLPVATTLVGFVLTYFFIERVRNNVALQTVALAQQQLHLDQVKADISRAAQRTAEAGAAVDKARLALQSEVARSSETMEGRRTQIQERQARTAEAGLIPDIAKLSNDIRPNVEIDCGSERLTITSLMAKCTFRNLSAFRVLISPTEMSVVDAESRSFIKDDSLPVDGLESTQVLPGGRASITFYPRLKNVTDRSSPLVIFRFTANTDPSDVAMTGRLARGYLTSKELRDLSSQNYIFRITPP